MESQDAVVAMVSELAVHLGHSALRASWHPGRTTPATKRALPG